MYIKTKNLIIALLIAVVLLLSVSLPVAAISLDEYFSLDFSSDFSTTEVTGDETFTVVITGEAVCTQDLPSPYKLASQARITGQVVAANEDTGETYTISDPYSLTIDPFPTHAGDTAGDSRTVSLQFPDEAESGTYEITGAVTQAKVKAAVWLTVTEYLPSSQYLGQVVYTSSGSSADDDDDNGGGSADDDPSQTASPVSSSLPVSASAASPAPVSGAENTSAGSTSTSAVSTLPASSPVSSQNAASSSLPAASSGDSKSNLPSGSAGSESSSPDWGFIAALVAVIVLCSVVIIIILRRR